MEDQKMGNFFLNTISPGEKLRLRDDVLPLVKKRAWIFAGMGKNDTVLLVHEIIGYIWGAKPGGIEWGEYKRRKNLE
jgi:hypothetical protein